MSGVLPRDILPAAGYPKQKKITIELETVVARAVNNQTDSK
jgi:hypothetical protein